MDKEKWTTSLAYYFWYISMAAIMMISATIV